MHNQDSDGGQSYIDLNLFQPQTALRETFETALGRVVDKIDALIPQFGQRNPRISKSGTQRYEFCIPD